MMIGSSPLALAVGGSLAPRAYLGPSLVYEALALSPPVRVSAPGITGSLVVGQTLAIGPPAVYSGNPEPTITYSWQSRPNGGGTIISHSNGTSFALTEDIAGRQIRTRDMASNSQGSVGWSVGAWSTAVAPAQTAIPGTIANPPFATALNWMAPGDMSHSPFINVLKISPELQSYGGSAPDLDWDALQSAGHITRNGTINSLPPNKDMIASSALNRFPAGSGYSGRYRLFYTGSGEIYMNGVDFVDDSTPGQIDFDFTANGENSVFFSVWGVTTPITFVAMVHHDHLAAYAAGKVFNEKWINIIRNERVIRFRQYTNAGNYIGAIDWATRYLPERMTYMGGGEGGSNMRGVPVEVMVDICNEVGADPWFPLIASASDSYATSFATLVRDRLDPKRHAYFELSDKVWDGANYATADYFRQLANTWYGSTSVESCMDAYGGRSAEVFAAIRTVWSGQLSRLHTVLQGWTPVPTLSVNVFTAPQWRALGSGRPEPWTLATEYAVHANMDGAMRGTDPEAGYDAVAEIQGWMDTLTDAEIYANMIQALRGTHPIVNDGYNLASIRANYQATKTTLAAYLPSLNTICYEGISHLVLPPGKQDDPKWIRIYRDLHRTAAFRDFMADVMTMWYQEWPEASHMFMRSSECRKPDAHNTEGLTWSLEDTGSDNLQYTYWVAQRAARQGATGRGSGDFVGTFEVA